MKLLEKPIRGNNATVSNKRAGLKPLAETTMTGLILHQKIEIRILDVVAAINAELGRGKDLRGLTSELKTILENVAKQNQNGAKIAVLLREYGSIEIKTPFSDEVSISTYNDEYSHDDNEARLCVTPAVRGTTMSFSSGRATLPLPAHIEEDVSYFYGRNEVAKAIVRLAREMLNLSNDSVQLRTSEFFSARCD